MQKKRFQELEGLRGVAAVVVAIYHFCLTFYLFAFFGPQEPGVVQHMRFEDNLYGNPLAVFLSGTFAVAIFFVLSGFVLSIGFFQSGKDDVVKKLASKRYLRLMLPALASTLICFFVIALTSTKTLQVSAITHSSWLNVQWHFSPSLFDAFKSGIYDIFTSQTPSPFNNVLWTMKTEFLGSFIVFGFLLLFGKVKYRWVAYVALLLGSFNTWFFAFVAGTALADLSAQGKLIAKKRSLLFITPVLGISLFMGGYPNAGVVDSSIYGVFSLISPTLHWNIILMSFGAIGVLSIILLSEQLSKLFASRLLNGLGKYTFSLYLVHIPVIFTVGLTTFLVLYNKLGLHYNISVIGTFLVTAPVVFGATLLFERYIDSPAIAFSSKMARVFLGEEEPAWNYQFIVKKLEPLKNRWNVMVRRNPVVQPEELEE